jgi:hypothetical protein
MQQFLSQTDLFVGLNITLQVMAITEMSPGNQYTVTSLFKRLQNKQRVDSARTHDAHGSDVGWILQPGYTGQIRTGIGTPVTQKSNYFWFKFIHYTTSLSIPDKT